MEHFTTVLLRSPIPESRKILFKTRHVDLVVGSSGNSLEVSSISIGMRTTKTTILLTYWWHHCDNA